MKRPFRIFLIIILIISGFLYLNNSSPDYKIDAKSSAISIINFTFSQQPFGKTVIVNIDNETYKVPAFQTLSLQPTYNPNDFSYKKCFHYSNIIVFTVPDELQNKINSASKVEFVIPVDKTLTAFTYKSGVKL